MYCKKCGYEIDEDAIFCPKCGTKQSSIPAEPESEQPAGEEEAAKEQQEQISAGEKEVLDAKPVPVENQKEDPEKPAPSGPAPGKVQAQNTIFILGLIGLAGNSVSTIGALIVSIIAQKKYQEALNKYGTLSGKAHTGNRLARIGKIVAIVSTAVIAAWILIALLVWIIAFIVAARRYVI